MPGTNAPPRAPQFIPTSTVVDIVDLATEYLNSAEQLLWAVRKLSGPATVEHALAGIGMEYLNGAEQTIQAEFTRALEVANGAR